LNITLLLAVSTEQVPENPLTVALQATVDGIYCSVAKVK